MPQLVKMKVGDSEEILVEIPESTDFYNVSRGSDILEKLDRAFDEAVQNTIVENTRVIIGAFEKLRQEHLKPVKASAEFGLQFTAEGNVYLVKTAAQASIKVSFEWQFS